MGIATSTVTIEPVMCDGTVCMDDEPSSGLQAVVPSRTKGLSIKLSTYIQDMILMDRSLSLTYPTFEEK
jgi:hypothetical protein